MSTRWCEFVALVHAVFVAVVWLATIVACIWLWIPLFPRYYWLAAARVLGVALAWDCVLVVVGVGVCTALIALGRSPPRLLVYSNYAAIALCLFHFGFVPAIQS